MNNNQATYWILTIKYEQFTPYLPQSVSFIKGQLERGDTTSYLHWQVYCIFTRQVRLSAVKKVFGDTVHAEPTYSEEAENYCWKEDTRVEGTQFTIGDKPIRRNNSADWDSILDFAKLGQFDGIPSDILIRNYGNLRKISVENAKPIGIERQCTVLWGPTGTGKSRTAWEEAGVDAYPKDPCTKFWDGYRGQNHVVIDEFRGVIGISHLLRWLDRYPVLVEVKGSSTVFKATKVWITSNLHPDRWYPDVDMVTMDALKRRLSILEIN